MQEAKMTEGRRLNDAARRSVCVTTRWTAAEHAALKRIAWDVGTTASGLLRHAMIDRIYEEGLEFPAQGGLR